MNLAESLLAALTATVCVVLLVRLCLGAARQQRFDAALRRTGQALRSCALRVWHWPAAQRSARREAITAIDRARRRGRKADGDDGEWTGNVYTPKSFRKPRGTDGADKLH